VDAVTFEGFILKEVLPKIKEGDCLIMDNAKIHLGEMVREIIEQEKARLIYLPPYSPEFSPIENFWSKVKAMLRKLKARTYKDLIEGIELAMLEVTQKDIRNWFGLLTVDAVPHKSENCYNCVSCQSISQLQILLLRTSNSAVGSSFS
jgi:transposase